MKYLKLLFISFFYLSIHAAQSWDLAIIQHLPLSYKHKCSLIDAMQVIKANCSITQSLLSRKAHQKLKIALKKQRRIIENTYRKKEQGILEKLGQSLQFSDNEWLECLRTIKNIKNNRFQFISSDTHHDQEIPSSLLSLISSLCTQNNLNPHTVNVVMNTIDNPNTYAHASIGLFYTYSPEATPFIQQAHIKQTITLSEKLTQETSLRQLAFCAHEVEHICQGHGIVLAIIEQYAQHYLQCGKETLNKNQDYLLLKVLHEEQAEIFAALKNAHVAQALVMLRSKQYYPQHLYEAHYHTLVKINNMWKIEQFIDKM